MAPPAAGETNWPLAFRASAMLVTVLGAAAQVAASVLMSGGGAEFLWGMPFFIWGLVPFGLGLFGVRRKGVGLPRSTAVTLASGFGLAMYANLIWSSHLSSTAGLAFLFVPLWQTVACAVGLFLTIPGRGKKRAA